MDLLAEILRVWESQQLAVRTLEHLYMFGIALAISTVSGVLIGILIYSRPRIATSAFNVLNVIETIPTLALLVLLLPVLGLGMAPTIAACILYSILPVARNTYAGLSSVSEEYIEVAKAIGMSEREIMLKIRFPLALPLIAGGFRIALVFTMGVVTLGGLIAAGGLGAPLQTGIHLYDAGIILVSGFWVGVLAVIFDGIAGMVEKALHSKFGVER
jgi:osmoprotectant transport system permease protein